MQPLSCSHILQPQRVSQFSIKDKKFTDMFLHKKLLVKLSKVCPSICQGVARPH